MLSEDTYVKKAVWVKFFCLTPKIDRLFVSQKRKLEQIGYIDSLLKYEMELIDLADLNTLNRLIEEYTMNISQRIKNTIKLRTNDHNYNTLNEVVKNIVMNQKSEFDVNSFTNEEYVDKVEGDLLKYYLILRFLKLRDLKFFILNVLNYFRFIQKKFAVDLYKIENKNFKRVEDLLNVTESIIL